MTVAVLEYDRAQDWMAGPAWSKTTNVTKADRAPTQAVLRVYYSDVGMEVRREFSPASERNWISRFHQIKAEIVGLHHRIPREGLVNPTAAALARLDYLVSALAGLREPIFEVDHDDGEISILWNDSERKQSVSINLDASNLVRIVSYKAGSAVQSPVHRLPLSKPIDAVAIQQILVSDGYREVVSG